jgi:hypothetical protein
MQAHCHALSGVLVTSTVLFASYRQWVEGDALVAVHGHTAMITQLPTKNELSFSTGMGNPCTALFFRLFYSVTFSVT